MHRGIGMSILLSWICLNTYAQLPHPNDTLENGKKVPFNQFLGRFSVFNEFGGAGFVYSLNASYSIIKRNLVLLDVTVGANRLPAFFRNMKDTYLDTYKFPVGLSLYLGRRRSRFNMRFGYVPQIYPSWYTDHDNPYPNCSGICPTPPQHSFYLDLGYVFQHHHGFFVGLHAYGLMTLPLKETARRFGNTPYFLPSGGLTFGYRLPSNQQHREWTERSFKRRVLRLEEPKQKPRKAQDELDSIFYGVEPLEVDSLDMLEIEKKMAKLKRQHERYLKEEQRLNGRSLVYAEFFGATGIASVNYTYTHPIARSKTFMMEYRGGFGSDRHNLQLPVHVGFKAMKNYRGTGVFLGMVPQYNPRTGSFGAVYFLEHNVEFHFAYGITGGVAFYLFYDPSYYKNYWNFSPYGGFFLGYRLPQMKKD